MRVMVDNGGFTVEGRKLEHARPPIPSQRKKEHEHQPPYIHVPTFFIVFCLLFNVPRLSRWQHVFSRV